MAAILKNGAEDVINWPALIFFPTVLIISSYICVPIFISISLLTAEIKKRGGQICPPPSVHNVPYRGSVQIGLTAVYGPNSAPKYLVLSPRSQRARRRRNRRRRLFLTKEKKKKNILNFHRNLNLLTYLNELQDKDTASKLLYDVNIGMDKIMDQTDSKFQALGRYFQEGAKYDTDIAKKDHLFLTGML